MGKLFRILGIAAMIAVIGFSFTACGGGGGGGDTYAASAFTISASTYGSALGSLGANYAKFGDVTELPNATAAQAEALYAEFRKGPFVLTPDEGTGLTLSDMAAYLRGVGLSESDINALSQKTTSQGFVIAGQMDGGNVGIIACRKL